MKWENRLRKDKGKTCKVNVDGTDFRIYNKKNFVKGHYYSHKFNGPAVCYEIASCIQTGDIVWFNGPFNPGEMNDLNISRSGLKQKLLEASGKAEADAGYKGEPLVIRHPDVFVSKSDLRAKSRSRIRHETINRCMKQFNCLSCIYRHKLEIHHLLFKAVIVITQILFDSGERPFQVKY